MSAWATKTRMLFVIALTWIASACGNDLCDTKVLEERSSPNEKYIATIFERNCGATTPFVRAVALRHLGSEFDPEESDNWVFTIHGQSRVQVLWSEDDKLRISFSPTGDKPTLRQKWEYVAISYHR